MVQPAAPHAPIDAARLKLMSPLQARAYLGDGNFAGAYEKPDAVMDALWQMAVEETRAVIERDWA